MTMPNPLTLLGDSLKAMATPPHLTFSPTPSAFSPPFGGASWLGAFPSGAKKDYGALVGDPLQNYVIAAAVNAVALALPDAPPYLETLRDGHWVRVDSHPVLDFLRQPHTDLDDADVWSLTSLYRLTRGEAFWIIHLSDAGQPTEAVPYDPRRVRVLGTRDELISGYEVTTEDGRIIPFPKAQVLHFRHLPDPNNPRRGWTPLSTGTRHLVGSNAASTYHTALLLNGAVSSWLISMRDAGQGNVTPEQFQTFIDAMRRKYSGTTESAGGIDGLSIPLEIQRMAYSPDEMAIDKLVNYYEQTLCSLTGVSKKLLDLGTDATYLNLREAISDFWERRLVPMRGKDARALTNQLLPLFGLSPTQWRIGFDFSGVPALQENQDALFTRWRDLYKAGGIDLYTLQTKIGLPQVPDTYKERFFNTPATQNPEEVAAKSWFEWESEEYPFKVFDPSKWNEALHPRGQPENSGEFAPSSLHGAETRAFGHLLREAKAKKAEFQYVVDAETGKTLGTARGTQTNVATQVPAKDQKKKWAAFHNHTNIYPPSDDDWVALAEHPQLKVSSVIGPKERFVLVKPKGAGLEKFAGEKSGAIQQEFQAQLHEELLARGHQPGAKVPTKILYDAMLATNRHMARKHGVKFHVSQHPKE